ncbi:MAG: type II secretion system protein [bacterium]|nr:type II secretion system protein [bacterium]
MSYFKKNKNQRGFTLVETLVSLVVLSFGLIPTLSVIVSSVNISKIMRNNLVAANLAQEGVEVVTSLRDSNWFNGVNFDNGLVGTWRVEWNTNWASNPPQSVTPETNPFVRLDPATGLYNYTTGSPTFFKRLVTVSLTANTCNCELVVVSEVTWSDFRRTRTIKAESHLFNWR